MNLFLNSHQQPNDPDEPPVPPRVDRRLARNDVDQRRNPFNRYLQFGLQTNPRLRLNVDSESDSISHFGSEDEASTASCHEEESEGESSPETGNQIQNDETEAELWKLTVAALKDLLRTRELPVSGRKNELIDRLLGRDGGKVKEWRKSKAKLLLTKLIEDDNSKIHGMSPEEIYESHIWFQNYTFSKFKTYLETIQSSNEYLKKVVEEDEREIWSELLAFPRNELTVRGYPFWDTHDACNLLEKDVKDGNADIMEPIELWGTREEYQAFPEIVFCHHVHQEKRRQREEPGWVAKRNKKAREMHEKDILQDKKSWDAQQHEQDISNICEMWERM